MNHDVFISYSSKDRNIALAICHVLEQNKIKCWIAPRDIPVGSDYGDLIDVAISACKLFIIVFSQSSSISQWVKGELNLAFSEQKYIVPFRIDETPLKGANRLILNQTHWIDAYPDYEQKIEELSVSVANFFGKRVNDRRTSAKMLSHSYGIAVYNGGEYVINNILLANKGYQTVVLEDCFRTAKDGQISIKLAIYEDNSNDEYVDIEKAMLLDNLDINWGFPVPKGTSITLRFTVEESDNEPRIVIGAEIWGKNVSFIIKI